MTLPAWIKGTMLLAVTLSAGFALGVAYERRHPGTYEAVGIDAHGVMHRFTRELDLDAEQQKAITRILDSRQREVDSTWHAVRPHVRATLDSTQQEIASVLRPDQLVKYRKMIEGAHPADHR